jgi:glutamate-ammonia-ligase adenylyltransferase
MIDELLDSLVLNQRRTADELRTELADLCRNATDLEPIMHSFQDKEQLRIGVRDILGKDTIQQTTAALSDLAETILVQMAAQQWSPLEQRFGVPALVEGERSGQPCRCVLLALGKFGGRELNYHSDLDLVFVYEDDGRTAPPPSASRFQQFELTDNRYFFTELAQHLIKALSYLGPMGRLYQVDMRLRPTGRSGMLVTPLHEFRRYFAADSAHLEGCAQLWERQALTRARVVYGDADFGRDVVATVAEGVHGLTWRPELIDEILSMRSRLEASRKVRDLKRGFGGLVDVEFLIQTFQIKYCRIRPSLRRPNTWQALDELRTTGLIAPEQYDQLRGAYDFLLRVQSRLRIVHNRALDEVPDAPDQIDKLARRLGFANGPSFLAQLEQHTAQTRAHFLQLLERERALG